MMRRYFFMVLTGIVLFTTAACTQDRQKAEAAIQALSDKFAAAWNRADGTAMALMYSEDGCLIDPFGVEARGRAAVDSLLTLTVTKILKGSTTRFETEYIRFLKPDVAFVDATQIINGAMSPEGEPIPETKLHLVLNMVKQNGQWWFVDARPYWFRLPPEEATEQ